jgi:nucleoside-diphosphate-sugar epimerase
VSRVLITGAAGFVGANLTRALLARGHEVHALVRPGQKWWRLAEVRDRLQLHEAQLAHPASVEAVVADVRPRTLFHLAVHGAYSSQTSFDSMLQSNVAGTWNLLQAAVRNGVETFVNTGSSSEYGFQDHAPREDEPLEPNSLYAVTKATATMLCRLVAHDHPLRVPTLRLYSVYGPWEEPTRLLPTLIVHAMKGRLPPLVSPSIARDFVYIDDVIDAYLAAAEHRGDDRAPIYNVGSGVQTTLADAVAVVRETFGITAEPAWSSMPSRVWDTNVWVSNPVKIREELGWVARVGFAEGVGRMAEWFAENPEICALYEQRQKV